MNFSENIYKECDSNYVISEIFRLTGCNDDIIRFCEGGTEIAIYFYDKSFDDMKRNILKCCYYCSSRFPSTYASYLLRFGN